MYTGMPWGLLLVAKAGREVTYDGHTSNVMFVLSPNQIMPDPLTYQYRMPEQGAIHRIPDQGALQQRLQVMLPAMTPHSLFCVVHMSCAKHVCILV